MLRIHPPTVITMPKETSAPRSRLEAVVEKLLYCLQSAAIVLGFLLAQVWIVQNSDGAAEKILLCVTVLIEFGLLAVRESFAYLRRD